MIAGKLHWYPSNNVETANATTGNRTLEYAAREAPMRPLVTIPQLWQLATTWYSTRLQEDSRRPKPDEMRSIFGAIGLEGEFWDPTADTFGS